jgi:ATP-dependent protease HslVU (ClpYQ) peptidase subunit
MTCVIGLHTDDGIWIGADSAGSTEYGARTLRADLKVHQNGEMLMGFCGSYRLGQILKFMKISAQPEGMDDFEYMVTMFVEDCREALKRGGVTWIEKNTEELAGSFMVGYRNGLYEIGSDFQVGISTKDYVCIGSGEEYAYGAMAILKDTEPDPVKQIKTALKVAADHNAFVAAPFVVRKLRVPS